MTFFHFAYPGFFLLLAFIPLIAWLTGRSGPHAAIRFSSNQLVSGLGRQRAARAGRILKSLRWLTLILIIVGLARPQLGRVNESIRADGIDIVLTLDLSYSMRALDLATRDNMITRWDAAKTVSDEFIASRRYDRISLVGFASEAYVISPLTLNHAWLRKNLARLDLGSIDGAGTAIGTALGASINRLRSSEADSRVVILLSDGENNAGEITPLAAAEAAAALGIRVYTIATGRQGRVPVARLGRDGRLVRDTNGDPVFAGEYQMSIFDDTELRQIAEITGGRFFLATEPGDLENIYRIIDELETTEVELRSHAEFTELFFWFALIALFLLLVEHFLAHTRYRRLP